MLNSEKIIEGIRDDAPERWTIVSRNTYTMIPVKYIKENRDTHEIKTSTYILMIVMIIILVLALASKCHASADSIDYRANLINHWSAWCDWWFGELWFQKVPDTIEHECRPRFSFNVDQINRAFISNSK